MIGTCSQPTTSGGKTQAQHFSKKMKCPPWPQTPWRQWHNMAQRRQHRAGSGQVWRRPKESEWHKIQHRPEKQTVWRETQKHNLRKTPASLGSCKEAARRMNRKQSATPQTPENGMSRQHESLIRIIARTKNLFWKKYCSSRFHETNKPKWKDPNTSPNNEIVDVKQPGLQRKIPFGLT